METHEDMDHTTIPARELRSGDKILVPANDDVLLPKKQWVDIIRVDEEYYGVVDKNIAVILTTGEKITYRCDQVVDVCRITEN